MTTNVIDAIREKEADAHAEREEAFAERNRLNQAFFDGKLIAYAEVLRLLGEDLEENDGYATCATIARGIPTTKSSCSEEDSVPDERIEKAAIAVFAAQTNWAEPNPTQKTVKALWDGQMDAVRDSFRRLAKAALDSLEDRPATCPVPDGRTIGHPGDARCGFPHGSEWNRRIPASMGPLRRFGANTGCTGRARTVPRNRRQALRPSSHGCSKSSPDVPRTPPTGSRPCPSTRPAGSGSARNRPECRVGAVCMAPNPRPGNLRPNRTGTGASRRRPRRRRRTRHARTSTGRSPPADSSESP